MLIGKYLTISVPLDPRSVKHNKSVSPNKTQNICNFMSQIDRKLVTILNVRTDSTSTPKVLKQVQEKIARKQKFYIVTPNPEIVLLANQDPELLKILNSADISLPDGIGLVAADKFLKLRNPKYVALRLLILPLQGLLVGCQILSGKVADYNLQVIRGREMTVGLIKLADKEKWKIFFLGGEKEEAKIAADKVVQKYSGIRIKSCSGPILTREGLPTDEREKEIETETVRQINALKPQLLFVGMGAPRQEKWVYRQLPKLSIDGAMVVGGTFRYIAGMYKLPPQFIVDSGLEWLWRLFTGSQNKERIIRAFPRFAFKVLSEKLSN